MSGTKQVERWECWAVVELMGHVRTGGRVTEEERFGVRMGRIDIPGPCKKCEGCGGLGKVVAGTDMPSCPACGGNGHQPTFVTQYFGGGSIYRLTVCDEAAARLAARSSNPAPVHPWEMPRALPPAPPAPETIAEPEEDDALDGPAEDADPDDPDLPY